MSQVPHRKAGEAALNVRREQEQQRGGGLRAIKLLHDERRLRGELGPRTLHPRGLAAIQRLRGELGPRRLHPRGLAAIQRRASLDSRKSAVALNVIIFIYAWWV